MSKPLLIIGAGGHGAVVADLALTLGIKVLGFADDSLEKTNRPVLASLKVETTISNLTKKFNPNECDLVLAIGDQKIRATLAEQFESLGYGFPTLVHPRATIARDCKIGIGTVVLANAILGPRTFIGNHCIVNHGVIIDHDNHVENYVHLAPGAITGGQVTIGEHSFIGLGTSIVNNISIGSRCRIPAGYAIYKSIVNDTILSPKSGKVWFY